jgi:hypothetical protein
MLQELVDLLPNEPGTLALSIALIGTAAGAGLCAVGARYSKPILTLVTVLLGAAIGMHLPQWFGWTVSGAGPAVGGAVVLGLSGWLLHRFWIGIGLGLVMSCWSALAVWTWMRNGHSFDWPKVEASTSVVAFLSALWHSLPTDVAKLLPYAAVVSMVSGVAMAILWDRPIVILMWSAAGTTLLAIMGVAAIDYGRPDWIKNMNVQPWIQICVLLVTLGISMTIQWKATPVPEGSGDKRGKKTPSEGAD